MLTIGTSLGQYQILGTLGSGGMGDVYRARDIRLGREVAIKVLPENLAKDPEMLNRFEKEARALAAISHPNILAIYDFQTNTAVKFAVMELLEGETLRKRIIRTTLQEEEAVKLAVDIIEGLAAAHSKGIIHRDLKPENIFITSSGIVKLLDFGLARVDKTTTPEEEDFLPTRWATETKPGMIMGTIPYMSPEQLRGDKIDNRTDIFSFGCVLYEMLTGRSPFYFGTMAETMAAILRDNPAEVTTSIKKKFPEVYPIVARCLEKDLDRRFQSAKDLSLALKLNLTSSTVWRSGATRSTSSQKPQKAQTRRRSKALDSLAIMPFSNASANPDAEYLSDGITESLINLLSQLPKLRVMARSTVFRYKNKEIDPQEIGQQLNVRAVLTGRVVQRGDLLNISAELVDVEDGSQLWGERYQRKFEDIFDLQDQLAEQISEKLRPKLSGEEKKRLVKHFTDNTEAYQLYLKGRHFWNKRTTDQVKKGITYFQQAIDLDPRYALAYTGLADSYILLGSYEILSPKDAFLTAKAATTKALEIENSLAEAHTSLAFVKHRYEWDWDAAEKEFRLAISLNPNYATAYQWYSTFLLTLGRFDEALQMIKRAQEVDPLSLIINTGLGMVLYYSGRYEEAIIQYKKVIEMDENFAPTYFDLAWFYMHKGKEEEAVAMAEKAFFLNGEKDLAKTFSQAYKMGGITTLLKGWLQTLQEEGKHGYSSPYRHTVVHLALGDREMALTELENAYKDRSNGIAWIKVDPTLDPLREEKRFIALLEKMKLA